MASLLEEAAEITISINQMLKEAVKRPFIPTSHLSGPIKEYLRKGERKKCSSRFSIAIDR